MDETRLAIFRLSELRVDDKYTEFIILVILVTILVFLHL